MNWVNIGSGNVFFSVRHQAITWTNAGLLSIGPLGTNLSEILIEINIFSLQMSIANVCQIDRHFVQGEMS